MLIRTRVWKSSPLLWPHGAPALLESIPLVLTWTGGFSPNPWALGSAPRPWQRPAASRAPRRSPSPCWCPRAAGSPAPSPRGTAVLLLPTPPQGHAHLWSTRSYVWNQLLHYNVGKSTSPLVIGCWGCKAAGLFGWGLCVCGHTCTFLSQCGFFFQPQENILQGCHANSIIDNSPVGAAVEATEQICVTQRPSVPSGFLHEHVSRDQTLVQLKSAGKGVKR